MSEATHGSKRELDAKAREMGLLVIYPIYDELLLDLDRPSDVALYYERIADLSEHYPFRSDLKTTSKNGRTHMYVSLDMPKERKLTDYERVALQAVLGSDHKREIYNLARIQRGDTHPTVLFETAKEAARIAAWRSGQDDIPF